jgi:hypothetical protein
MNRLRCFLGFVFFARLVVGCGEDVNLSSGQTSAPPSSSDASVVTIDASDQSSDASLDSFARPPADARIGRPVEPDARTCPAPGEGGVTQCGANGTICRTAKDCCTGRCVTASGSSPSTTPGMPPTQLPEIGYCLPENPCAAPGAECSTRNGCCSARCEPTGRMGTLVCGPFCMPIGARCTSAADCCALACNGGTCGGALCRTAGTACTVDSECCSGRCGPTGCVELAASCLPTGEACDKDGECCSGLCDNRGDSGAGVLTGRCDLGVGPCREPSTPCINDNQCCRVGPGAGCVSGACTAPCLPDGQYCNSNGDCCGGVCGGPDHQCETPVPGCP